MQRLTVFGKIGDAQHGIAAFDGGDAITAFRREMMIFRSSFAGLTSGSTAVAGLTG